MAFVFWGWVRKAARLLRYVGYLLLLVPILAAAFLATHPIFNVISGVALIGLIFGTAPDWEGEFAKKHLLLYGGCTLFILVVAYLQFHMLFVVGEMWYEFQEHALMPFFAITSILNLVVVCAASYHFVKTANVLWWREYYRRNN